MRPFRFESVLRYRRRIEEQKQKELAEVQRRLLTEVSRLRYLEERREEARTALDRAKARGVLLRELVLHDAYLEGLAAEICIQRKRLYDLHRAAERKREELLDSSRRKKVLEKLEERDRERQYREELRRERIRNDEIAAARYVRSLRGGRP